MVETSDRKRTFPLFTAAVLLMGLALLFVVFFVISKIIQKSAPTPSVSPPRQNERGAALTKEVEQLRQNIEQERKNTEQLRRQNAELTAQRADAQKKIGELSDRLKAIHGDECSIRRWFLTGADVPEKGWSLVPSASSGNPS